MIFQEIQIVNGVNFNMGNEILLNGISTHNLKNIDIKKITSFFILSKNFGQWFKHLKLLKNKSNPKFESYF